VIEDVGLSNVIKVSWIDRIQTKYFRRELDNSTVLATGLQAQGAPHNFLCLKIVMGDGFIARDGWCFVLKMASVVSFDDGVDG
jgi:hypothetical protein